MRLYKVGLMVAASTAVLLLSLTFLQSTSRAYAPVNSDHFTTTVITQTVVLTPRKDNTLYEDTNGATSNGSGAFFFVGATADGAIRRGLLAFDLAGEVPAGATIISTTLQLQISKSAGGVPAIGLHRLLVDWGEGTSDASGNEGSGVAATNGDATWRHTHFDTALWQTPGGDFVPTATASITVADIGTYSWPSSPAMVAEVQQWLDDGSTNFGWALIGDESNSRTAKRFVARESSAAASRPQLTVVYTMTGTEPSIVYLPLIQN